MHVRSLSVSLTAAALQREKSVLVEHSIDVVHRIDWPKVKVVERETNSYSKKPTSSPANRALLRGVRSICPLFIKDDRLPPLFDPDVAYLWMTQKFVNYLLWYIDSKKAPFFESHMITEANVWKYINQNFYFISGLSFFSNELWFKTQKLTFSQLRRCLCS